MTCDNYSMDKLIDSASSEELVALLRKAQAERDALVTENLKLETALTIATIRLDTAIQENRAPLPASV